MKLKRSENSYFNNEIENETIISNMKYEISNSFEWNAYGKHQTSKTQMRPNWTRVRSFIWYKLYIVDHNSIYEFQLNCF